MTEQQPTRSDLTLQLYPFPGELRRRFKAACARAGLKMHVGAAQAIEQWTTAREREGAGQ